MTGRSERREQITAEIVARTGITEAMIERLVRAFYAKVRADAVLGPIFEARIRDWEPHLAADVRLLVVGRADDRAAITARRWSSICRCRSMPRISIAGWRCSRRPRGKSVRRQAEAHFVERARRIAASLELGVAGAQGVMLGRANGFGAMKQEQSDETQAQQRRSPWTSDVIKQQIPFAGSSLVPMLVIGLVLTFAGNDRGAGAELRRNGPPRHAADGLCERSAFVDRCSCLRRHRAAALAQADILQLGEHAGGDRLRHHR